MAIAILPIFSISDNLLEDLEAEIGNAFISRVIVLRPATSIPSETYNKQREQYDADLLIRYIRQLAKNISAEKLLAVGNLDSFIDSLNYVFGAAEKDGHIALLSLYRLDPRFYGRPFSHETLSIRAAKEAIHELGHCYGLDHCKRSKCVMRSSNDIMSVDLKEKSFCENCRERLRDAL